MHASKESPRMIHLSDHVISANLPLKPNESVVAYAERLLEQAFYPRAGMNDREMELLGKAHDYIRKLAERSPLEIIRYSADELKQAQVDIANIFGINPLSRKLATQAA